MGTVVHFPSRQPDGADRTKALLEQIGRTYREQEKAREALPQVLAQLVQAGETELVLQAVLLWGSGEAEPLEILRLCESHPDRRPN